MGTKSTKKYGGGVKNPYNRGVSKGFGGVEIKIKGKGGKMATEKRKYAFYASQEIEDKIEQLYKSSGCTTRTEFIERAVDFYCGYLTAENYKEYFPNVIVSTMKATLDAMETHLARNFFKMAVEQAMMMHVLAYTQGVDEDTLGKLRGYCVAECKRINGAVSFADAVRFQNSGD